MFLALLTTLPLALAAQEQAPRSKRVSLELKAGVGPGFTSQKFAEEKYVTSKNRIGLAFEAGATLFYNFRNNLSLGAGLQYQKRGGGSQIEMRGIGRNFTDKASMQFHYLTIPIQMRVYFFNRKFNVYGGVGLGFCLKAVQVFNKNDHDGYRRAIKNPEKFVPSLDLGAAYAVARDIDLGIGTNIGLTKAARNVLCNPRGSSYSDVRFHTLLLYCAFRL